MLFGTLSNGDALGESLFTEENNLPAIVQSNLSGARMRSQYGFNQRSRRVWTRSYEWTPQPVSAADVSDVTITISTTSGNVLGRIRTDIEKPILQSITFTLDESGCADFTLRLNTLPTFEILPFSIVDVKIANTTFNWFSGVVTSVDEGGTRGGVFRNNKPYEYRGFGRRRYIEQLRADTDFASLLDVGEVARQLFQTYVAPYAPINYTASQINSATGVVLAALIELGKFSLRQVFDTLAQMANAYWGVDGDGNTFFEERVTAPVRTFAVGYKVNDFDPKLSYENIKNAIIVQRQQGRGSGGAGWIVAGLYNDASSVKKYGRNELVYQIPGYFSDSDADIIGNALISRLAEPDFSAEVSGIVIESESEYLERGNYRFIMPLDVYRDTVSDIDNATAFTIVGAGDLAVTNDPVNFVYANGGVKLAFQNAVNQRAELSIYAAGLIKEIRFYVRQSITGVVMQAGVGEFSWSENTVDIDVQAVDEFIPFVWDVSALNLRKLQRFAVKVKANQSQAVDFWVDKLDVIYRGHKAYTLELKRATYTFGPQGSTVKAEFGTLPRGLSEYVAGLLATTSELKFTGEVR